ncbi:MAG: FAD-dependent oxidoreductase [Acetobacteraceae bacterium]|nr:FAD-dependent oxidoreductase [Acetobacteraceae bacterium]
MFAPPEKAILADRATQPPEVGMNVDIDVVVIGAGLAGLGAAAALKAQGRSCLILEASGRIGGRAWTTNPASLGGVWFDMGAVWFHDAENNPLVPIAEAAGDRLLRSNEIRTERTYIGSREATDAEARSYADAWPRFEEAADALLSDGGDVSLADVTRSLPGDPWAATVEAWEGPVICAVDANRFSARDWRRNALGGSNLVAEGGIGAFVARRLTTGLDIRLNTPALRIRWGGKHGRVSVETATGTLTAGACIVTVSTGVLAAGTLAFEPALPPDIQESIHALPMGLALKVALRANGPDRLDLPLHCSVDRQIARSGLALMPFQCWPFGRDYVQGWIGGGTAWDLAKAGEAAAVDHALSELRAIFGGRVDRLFAGGGSLVTSWDADPWVRGAYCYAIPGQSHARDRLGIPLADGHLMFAGEACNVPYAGTLAGAWISGQAAAAAVSGG